LGVKSAEDEAAAGEGAEEHFGWLIEYFFEVKEGVSWWRVWIGTFCSGF
jgi:hypothetical protein